MVEIAYEEGDSGASKAPYDAIVDSKLDALSASVTSFCDGSGLSSHVQAVNFTSVVDVGVSW